jgi:hypothetical protein
LDRVFKLTYRCHVSAISEHRGTAAGPGKRDIGIREERIGSVAQMMDEAKGLVTAVSVIQLAEENGCISTIMHYYQENYMVMQQM